jgi:hypothetical protein
MIVYIIAGTKVTAHAVVPAHVPDDNIAVRSAEELLSSPLSGAQLVAVWNALPGVTTVAKFADRRSGVRRLWTAFTKLPIDEPPPVRRRHKATQDSKLEHPSSKQAQVIALLRRPEGATIEVLMAATGWQCHTVRGAIAGALKTKLGLAVLSEKTEAGRTYRIAD